MIPICLLLFASAYAQMEQKTAVKPGFVPGKKIIFLDDFSTGKMGDFPLQWTTNGGGEIVTNPQFPGRWFQMAKGGYFIPKINEKLTDNFTIEFDFVLPTSLNTTSFTPQQLL